MRPRLYVFVAGPLRSSGLLEYNVRAAAEAGNALIDRGFVPFVPHLNVMWNLAFPRPEADWIEWDNAWLARCDAVLRLFGESRGADAEVRLARMLDIPVFESIDALAAWRDARP